MASIAGVRRIARAIAKSVPSEGSYRIALGCAPDGSRRLFELNAIQIVAVGPSATMTLNLGPPDLTPAWVRLAKFDTASDLNGGRTLLRARVWVDLPKCSAIRVA